VTARIHFLTVRVTPTELERLEERASRDQITLSDMTRVGLGLPPAGRVAPLGRKDEHDARR
jgi:hypothetical protein